MAAPRARMFLTRMGPGPWTEESLVTTVKPSPSVPAEQTRHRVILQCLGEPSLRYRSASASGEVTERPPPRGRIKATAFNFTCEQTEREGGL